MDLGGTETQNPPQENKHSKVVSHLNKYRTVFYEHGLLFIPTHWEGISNV